MRYEEGNESRLDVDIEKGNMRDPRRSLCEIIATILELRKEVCCVIVLWYMAKGRTQPLIYKKLIGLRRMREIRTYGRNTTSYLDRFPPVTSREPGVAKVPALLVEGLE